MTLVLEREIDPSYPVSPAKHFVEASRFCDAMQVAELSKKSPLLKKIHRLIFPYPWKPRHVLHKLNPIYKQKETFHHLVTKTEIIADLMLRNPGNSRLLVQGLEIMDQLRKRIEGEIKNEEKTGYPQGNNNYQRLCCSHDFISYDLIPAIIPCHSSPKSLEESIFPAYFDVAEKAIEICLRSMREQRAFSNLARVHSNINLELMMANHPVIAIRLKARDALQSLSDEGILTELRRDEINRALCYRTTRACVPLLEPVAPL